jgi:hypothetical protein
MSYPDSFFTALKQFFQPGIYADPQLKRTLWFIFLLGFTLRAVLCFIVRLPHEMVDSYGYIDQADSIVAGSYINYFPNGYPFIIAFFKVISKTGFITLLLWLNVLMATVNIYFVYDISKRIFNNSGVALFAALLVSVFPTQINYVRWVLTEVPTTFFMLGFYFFYLRNKNLWAGLFFGIATVIRTEVLAVFLLIILLEILIQKRIRAWMVAGVVIPIILISSYCYLKTGTFSMSGHSRANIMYSITSSGGYVDWFFQDKHPEITTTDQAVKMYFDYLKADPFLYLKNRAANLWELWGFFPSSSGGVRSFSSRLMIGFTNFFLILFAALGAWKSKRLFFTLILVIPFVVVTGIHTLLLALPRYTYTAEPFLIILSAYAVSFFVFRKKMNPGI